MKSQAQHDADVENMRLLIAEQTHQTLSLDSHTSNIIRSAHYKQSSHQLAIKKLNQLISINRNKLTVLVEPRVTMEQLHNETYQQGFLVPVIPEFKGITVGGAIMGAAIESSSHKHGQFNDICVGYEILLGDGSKVWASENENSDLFFGIPGSYGSLGIITLVEIKLEYALPYIELHYHHFNNAKDSISFLKNLKTLANPPNYIEGIIYSPHQAIIVEGHLQKKAHSQEISIRKPWDRWYYQHLKNTNNKTESIPVTDYFFRHDRGAFWMGSYATHFSLFTRYLFEGVIKSKMSFLSWEKSAGKYSEIKDPGPLFRFLMGWLMPSQTLYGLLHKGSENWFKEKFLIQDYYIPDPHVETFVQQSMNQHGLFPIWLCPVRGTKKPQIFSPHYSPTHNFIDIGLYGLTKTFAPLQEVNRYYEQMTRSMEGRKMLYSHSFYTPEEFWQIYSQGDYLKLRKKYHAEAKWLSIEEKVLE